MRTPLLTFTIAFTATLFSEETLIKHRLKSDKTIKYRVSPKSVESLSEALTEGIFYGRIRSNSFIYNRDGDDNDYVISAFGGSIIYRSGYLNGFGFTTALYNQINSYFKFIWGRIIPQFWIKELKGSLAKRELPF